MITVEIIAIGNEILSGYIINRNAAYISRELTSQGFHVVRHTAIGDQPQDIESALHQALQRSDVIITTGGLGPTLDDLTRTSIAKVMNSGMRIDEKVRDDLIARYGNNLRSLEDQSTVPEKAIALLNPVGTAPGLLFDKHEKILCVLPGVPYEMESLFSHQFLPWLCAKFKKITKPHLVSLNVIGIPEQEIDVVLRQIQETNPNIQIGIYPNHWIVVVRISAKDPKLLEAPCAKLRQVFKDNIFESEQGLISDAVHHLFKSRKLTLSCAESCTGGAIAAALTQYNGASEYFLGSIVAYSNEMKENLLGVPAETIQKYGAVSRETAAAMLEHLLQKTGSDWGISVTGIAGPAGGTPDKPVGTIWCGIGKKDGNHTLWKLQLHSDRTSNIKQTVNLILGQLYLVLN